MLKGTYWDQKVDKNLNYYKKKKFLSLIYTVVALLIIFIYWYYVLQFKKNCIVDPDRIFWSAPDPF
jgi:uncharacterized membrane protein YukC